MAADGAPELILLELPDDPPGLPYNLQPAAPPRPLNLASAATSAEGGFGLVSTLMYRARATTFLLT